MKRHSKYHLWMLLVVKGSFVIILSLILNSGLIGSPLIIEIELDSTYKPKEQNLFFIARSKDDNRIFYDLALQSNGKLTLSEPIDIYWLKCSKEGKSPLTFIQKKFAYGLTYTSISDNQASFKFVSHDKMEFVLKNTQYGYKVFTELDKQKIEVENIYVVIKGGTFWLPKVPEVHIIYRTKDGQLNTYKLLVNKDG